MHCWIEEFGKVAISRIFVAPHDTESSPGIKGASIAAVKKLSGENYQTDLLISFLELPNQNDRQCAVNDIIDCSELKLLPLVLKTPVAPSFRMRALNILWPDNVDNLNGLDLFCIIEKLIFDNPNNLELNDSYEEIQDEKRDTNKFLEDGETPNPYYWQIIGLV